MSLIAYWLGQNIVAAASPADAVLVMDRHERPGKWQAEDAVPLTAAHLAQQLDGGSDATIADELSRLVEGSRTSRLAATLAQGNGVLMYWDYPRD